MPSPTAVAQRVSPSAPTSPNTAVGGQLQFPSSSPRASRPVVPGPCCGFSVLSVIRVIFLVLLLTGIVLGAVYFDEMRQYFFVTLNYVNELGPLRGSVVLAIANILAALLAMPCLPFTLSAGFLYGTFLGSLIVSVASTLAAVIAFLAARYLARTWIEAHIAAGGKTSKFRIIDSAICSDGFRIVLLIRSSPLHPYGVCNYLFGLTSVTLRDYTVASFLGMIPATILEVYFGTAIQNVADLVSGNLHNSLLSRIFFYVGLMASLAATVALTVRLKRMLRTELEKYEAVQLPGDDDLLDDDDDDSFFGVISASRAASARASPVAHDTALELAPVATHTHRSDMRQQLQRSRSSSDARRSNERGSDLRRLTVAPMQGAPSGPLSAGSNARRSSSSSLNGNHMSSLAIAGLHAALDSDNPPPDDALATGHSSAGATTSLFPRLSSSDELPSHTFTLPADVPQQQPLVDEEPQQQLIDEEIVEEEEHALISKQTPHS